MSEPVSLKQQVKFISDTLDTHEETCGVKVEMGRMTKAEAERRTAKLKAVLATLKKAEAAGGVAESAMKEMAPNAIEFTRASVMSEVHKCARRNAHDCEHCASIANILDEVIGNK